jgi:hypothetical protein
MTELFGRRAIVTVDRLELADFDVSFRIEKTLKPEPNTLELAIFNLNPDHRAALEELRPKETTPTRGIPCKIEAGYGDELSLLWLGDLRTVESQSNGPDWITNLTSGDGEKAYQNARINVSYGPATPLETALRAMVRALGVDGGNLAKVVAKLRQGGSAMLPAGAGLSGQAAQHLDNFARSADLEWSIQDGALQILERGKALSTKAIELTPETGLIGSPTVDNEGLLKARMLVIPDVRPGTLLVVKSQRVEGNYRTEKAVWDCDTSGGPWYVDVEASRY